MKNRSANAQTLQTMGHKYSGQLKKAILFCLALILSFSFCISNVYPSTDEGVLACENELREYIENPAVGIDTSRYTLEMEGSVVELNARSTFESATATLNPDGTYHFESDKGMFSYYAAFVTVLAISTILLYYIFYGILFLIIKGIKYVVNRIKSLCEEYTTTKNMAIFNISKEDAEKHPDAAREKEAYDAGFKKGYDEGYVEGRTAGFGQGMDDTYEYGFDEGHSQGYVEGVKYAMEHLVVSDVPAEATEAEKEE
ncbi:MAG: hypothetical protein IJX99_02340 [Clostridia bacterium]|nr:hypothetical protein [Clostridia bacterium]